MGLLSEWVKQSQHLFFYLFAVKFINNKELKKRYILLLVGF